MSESHPERRPYDPPMSPDQNYVEINAYVVGWGLFFAALFSLAVGYLCLKIGQTVDAFAPVSVLAMGMAVLFKRKNAFPETVHIQAIASAGTNIIGGVMFILPALFILQLNSQLTYTEMVIPIVLGGVLAHDAHGQQRVTAHHFWSTIVSRVQSQAAVRFQTDVVAVDQPGFRMDGVI